MSKSRVADIIGDQVRKAVDGALSDSKDLLTQVAQAGGKEAANDTLGKIADLTSIIRDAVIGTLFAEGGPLEALALLGDVESGAGNVGRSFGWGYILGYGAYTLAEPFFHFATREVERLAQSRTLDPALVGNLVARGLMHEDNGRVEAEWSGIDNPRFDHLVAAATTHPDITALLELWRRGYIDEPFVTTTLKRLGYSDESIPELLHLKQSLVSPADLALAWLRTDIGKDELYTYGARLGMDKADMDLLVGNTGEPLAPQQLNEAYRRGFIDKERLLRGYRQSRIRNEWDDVAEMLRFAPMTVADAVRAVVENYITPEEGKKIAEQNGLLPEHFPILHESWGRPLAHMEMASLVHRGIASRKQFDQAMRESDIKDKYIEQSFRVADRLLPERMIVSAIHYGALSIKEGAKLLLQLGYSPEHANILLQLGLHEQRGKPKEISKAEILKLYEDGLRDREWTARELAEQGYDSEDVQAELAIADAKVMSATLRQETAILRSSVLAGRLTAADAANQLHQYGMSAAAAETLVERWQRAHGRGERTLTEAQILRAVEHGAISEQDASHRLQALGFDAIDAEILLKSHAKR
jgi:hypothetical protein